MSKKNKWTIVPFIIVSLLIIAVLTYLAIRKPSKPAEPLKAIPLSASIIVKINDYHALQSKITGNNDLWNQLKHTPLFKRIDLQLDFIDSLISTYPDVNDIFSNTPLFISAHFTGKEKISLLHVMHLPSGVNPKNIRDLINRQVIQSGTIKTRSYEGIPIYEVALLNQTVIKNFSFSFYRDLLLISFSATLMEDALRQLISNESVMTLRGFEQSYSTAGKNVIANVFINFQQFPKSLSAFVKPEFKSEVRSFKDFAGWAELDLNTFSDKLLMNGFVDPSDSIASMARIFVDQAPQKLTADQILPSTTGSFIAIGISDAARYFEDYRSFLSEQGNLTGYNNTLQSLNNAYGTKFPDELFDLTDKEIALGFDGNTPEGSIPGVYILFRIRSKTETETRFRTILQKIAAVESKPLSAYLTRYRFDAELSFDIYHLPVRKFTAKIFGSMFEVLDEHYFTVLDNYLVFAGSVESIKYLIQSTILNKTLESNPAYKEFKNNMSPRSNLCFYCNLSTGQGFYSAYLNEEINRQWRNNLEVFQQLQVTGMQLYSSNGMLYTNLLLKHLSSYKGAAQTVWESKIDTLADFKPVFVMNHQTGKNEVFVQDLKNNIYLINQAGRILWKIMLPNQINSEVFQVDYFRNGKLQLLFSTEKELYLIDRNGNFVEKYPVKLRSKATCGVSVFDYDKNRDYRLFIACEDRQVYAYSRDGSLVSGWSFGESESEVTQPISHFRIGDRDFLVFGDRIKTYILDRKGSTRVNVDTYFPRSVNNNYLLDIPTDGSPPSLVATDTAGKVYFIGFTGSIKTVELSGDFSSNHYFDYKDLTGDNKPEFIFLENNRLMVYAHDESELFTVKFNETIRSRPMYYQFSSTDRKLGIISRDENLVYLINNNGKIYEGFPLQGNTPFSIGQFGDSLSRFNLIVGSRDNFLYNYRVK
jgi:hypothetical protein